MKLRFFSIMLLVCLLVGIVSIAVSEEIQADLIFSSASAYLDTTKIVELFAMTRQPAHSISVNYCKLYRWEGSMWQLVNTQYPSYIAYETRSYETDVNFSTQISTGMYKIKVCYNADGNTKTIYSNTITF